MIVLIIQKKMKQKLLKKKTVLMEMSVMVLMGTVKDFYIFGFGEDDTEETTDVPTDETTDASTDVPAEGQADGPANNGPPPCEDD